MTDALVLLCLILFGGFLAMAEMAVGASRPSRLQKEIQDGSAGAAAALRLREKPSKLLSATQLGITVAALLSGIFGEASWVESLIQFIVRHTPALAPFAYPLALFVVVGAITFVSLVLGEVVPRRIALARPEACAAMTSPLVEKFLLITTPVIWLVSKTSDALVSFLPTPRTKEISTQDEIRMLIDEGRKAGGMHSAEGRMIENVFRMDERRVAAIMTPASDIVFLDIKTPSDQIVKTIMEKRVSRLVVCKGGLADIIGWVPSDDALRSIVEKQTFDIGSVQMKPMLFVPSNQTIFELLEAFRKNKTGVAVAVNEFGAVDGIVTSSDLLGTMIAAGEVHEGVGSLAVRRDDGSWLLDGLLPADEMMDILGFDPLPDDLMGSFHTVGGFMVSVMGRIPRKAESFEFNGWRLEIVDMDRNRVDEVMAKKLD